MLWLSLSKTPSNIRIGGSGFEMNSPERRKNNRISIPVSVEYVITPQGYEHAVKIRGRTKDISPTGMSVVSSSKLSGSVELELILGQKKMAVTAKVLWEQNVSPDIPDITQTGLVFLGLTSEDKKFLQSYLARHKKRPQA